MKIEFDKTGAERKALVKAIGEIMEVKPKYLGMPTAAYEVDYFHIDKNGTVEFDDRADSEEIENLLERLAEMGFTAARTPAGATEAETEGNNTPVPESAPEGENTGLTVEMPRGSFTDAALGNLRKLVDSKAALIKKALGVENLPIEVTEDRVSFPWFAEADGESARAYTHLITALCDMARNAKRVTAAEKTVDNEKYAFRCFLLRLGFIGAEYKAERKVLLRNLTGNGAFKSGTKARVVNDKVTVICYGQREDWDSRKKAADFYLQAIAGSDGSERDRYTKIYTELLAGDAVCTDCEG